MKQTIISQTQKITVNGRAKRIQSTKRATISAICIIGTIKISFQKNTGPGPKPQPRRRWKSNRELAALDSTHDDLGDGTNAPPHQHKDDGDADSTGENGNKGGRTDDTLDGVNDRLKRGEAHSRSSSLRSFLLSSGIYPAGIFWVRGLESNQHLQVQGLASVQHSAPRYKAEDRNRTCLTQGHKLEVTLPCAPSRHIDRVRNSEVKPHPVYLAIASRYGMCSRLRMSCNSRLIEHSER